MSYSTLAVLFARSGGPSGPRKESRMHIALLSLALVLAVGAPAAAQPAEQPRAGGVFRVAMIGEPPTLDLHTTTAVIVQQITWHIYETLYTYDRQYNAIPLLVDTHSVTDNGRTYVFRLRRGVKFHNGKEMTAADVVASLKRWGRLATPGKQFWKNVEGIEAKDPYTVAMYLKDSSGALLMGLARPNNGAVIYPKEIVDAAGDNAVKEYVGTGPYRFVEHKPDRHVRVARFKDYVPRTDAPEGFGGRRTAYLDEILFIPVPDVAVRLARGGTGEHHPPLPDQQDPDARHEDDARRGCRSQQARSVEHRRPQPQAGPDDRQADPPGFPGRARHGADHGGRLRQQGLLPAGPGALVPRATAVALARRRGFVQP